MGRIARMVADDTLLTLALAYEGDTHCRGKNVWLGIRCLEAARDATPCDDPSLYGLTSQLLARAYLKSNRTADFVREMAEAEGLASSVETGTNTTCGQYSLGAVYEEYGYSYVYLGRFDQAITYLDRAEENLEHTTYWKIQLKTARAMALVQRGDFHQGVPLVMESIKMCKQHGMLRLLERMYTLRRYLERMAWHTKHTSMALQEVLEGPLEPPFWYS
jgi:tetratricopeptide (TPR) repeat protein